MTSKKDSGKAVYCLLYLPTSTYIKDLFIVRQTKLSIFMHFLSMFIYVSFRTARHFPVIVTHFGSQHFLCMLSSLSKPASLMQPASRSAMARIEPEGSEGRSISLSSSGWKETNKESVI